LDPRVQDKTICIGTEDSQQDQSELSSFLDKNSDVFAWSTSNLVRVSKHVMEHRLQVSPNANPKKEKLKKMAEEKVQATKVEVQRLLDVGCIREVTYPEWLSKLNYLSDLVETFTNMREARLKLNPEKCVFEITRGKVLGSLYV
jgi:hypothetical protein